MISNVEFTLMHELIRVLIDDAGIPVPAREEDQADYLTATTLLSQDANSPVLPAEKSLPLINGRLISDLRRQAASHPCRKLSIAGRSNGLFLTRTR